MPEVKEKVVKIRADRVKPEYRTRLGVTDEMLALGEKSPRVAIDEKLLIPTYPTVEEMISGEGKGDVNAGKVRVLKLAQTQLGTTMANELRGKFEIAPVSTSVKDADAMQYAAKNDREGLTAAILAAGTNDAALREYLDGIKTKILAQRQADGILPEDDEDNETEGGSK